MDPFLFLTDDTEETIKKAGLRQIRVLEDDSNTGLQGTNKRTLIGCWRSGCADSSMTSSLPRGPKELREAGGISQGLAGQRPPR